ncbi:MAG: hypothetical protein U0Y08_08660 [Bacteroidia bacterium]
MFETEPIDTSNWSSFKSHEIIASTEKQFIWQSTKTRSRLFFRIAIVFFALSFLFLTILVFSTNKSSKILPILSVIFLGVVFYRIAKSPQERIVFDKNLDRFYFNHQKQLAASIQEIPDANALSEIIGIQLLRSRGSTHFHPPGERNPSYIVFQLNILLANGHRENIFTHGDLLSIRIDAGKLSQFLNVPVHDEIPVS